MKNKKNLPELPQISDTVRELVLYAENCGDIYPQFCAICKNLNKHNKRGNFDWDRAAAAFLPWLVIAAKHYIKDCCSAGEKYYNIFSAADRRIAAKYFAVCYQLDFLAGNMAWLDAE